MFFSSTKLEKRVEQVLSGSGGKRAGGLNNVHTCKYMQTNKRTKKDSSLKKKKMSRPEVTEMR
jgi:hypothetical protein